MIQSRSTHYWLRGGLSSDRARALSGLGVDLEASDTLVVNAHRRLRGPFTAADALARFLAPGALTRDPELIKRYDIELLSAAAELRDLVPNSRETLTSISIPAERTRYYARLRTVRIGHGLVEFISESARAQGLRTVVMEQVDQADPTDLEFLASLVRRLDPSRLQAVICTPSVRADENDERLDEAFLTVLHQHATLVEIPTAPIRANGTSKRNPGAYVMADCVSDDPADLAAYLALDPAQRPALHDRRAEQIEALGQESLRIGALAHHREHGSDPAGAGVKAVFHAMDHCLCLGYYAACVEYGRRGLSLVDPSVEHDRWWAFAKGTTLALSILGRTEEAESLDDLARLVSTKPGVHMNAAYSTAMLYTRHNNPERRDQRKAKSWLNAAIATASTTTLAKTSKPWPSYASRPK